MTLETGKWYRVKDTRQFCLVTRIASTADPQRTLRAAEEGLKGFHAYLLWFSPAGKPAKSWTKRGILMDLGKAFRLLRTPTEEDRPLVRELKLRSRDIPLVSLSVDGVKTKAPEGGP